MGHGNSTSKIYMVTTTNVPSKPNNHKPTSSTEGNNTTPSNDSSNTDEMYVNELVISEISLSEDDNAVTKLKHGKSAGTDKITNEVLKCLPSSWLSALQEMFSTILRSGEYPTKWAEIIIQPIYKSGNKDNCRNYRGISLISCIGKFFTSI